ncbi:MAG: ComEC/Rec2 family competence protein [Bacteroidetes bacterium]|nr:ComEC/Rec2 family competence protein [Bacteroidota bacterium]
MHALGILSGYPILSRLWQPRWRPIRYIWQLTVVTLTAQFAVTPLSVFYFKQFPGLFLISNWMILPFFGGLLGLSFMITGANLISLKILGMNEIYDWIVHTFNRCINTIAAQENLIFTDLKLNLAAVLLLYFFIAPKKKK